MIRCSICQTPLPGGATRTIDEKILCAKTSCTDAAFSRSPAKESSPRSTYDADYYLHGRKTGQSLYDNYRWLPEVTVPMAQRIADHLGVEKDAHTICDFGCARGFMVKAFRQLGYDAVGVDPSPWPIEQCDPEVKPWVACTDQIPPSVDWIVAKDVLEHVPQVADCIDMLMAKAKLGVFAVVPLSVHDGMPYVVPDYELDVTHIHRLSLATWGRMFCRPGWDVTLSYRVRGVKDSYQGWNVWVKENVEKWGDANGFLTARRQ